MQNSKREIVIAKANFQPTGRELCHLEYALLTVAGPEGEELYAIRVDMRSACGILLEREESPGITGSLEDATVMATAFANGSVPPYFLMDMVEEWDPEYYAARKTSNVPI